MPRDVARNAPPITHADLMEPVAYRRPFTAKGWLFEMKFDGLRVLARRRNGLLELISAHGRSLGAQFPEVMARLGEIPGAWHLDAELVVPDARGLADWDRARRRALLRHSVSIAAAAASHPAALIVFDILTHGREDVRDRSTNERKERLADVVVPVPGLQIARTIETEGERAFERACSLGTEGVVAKKIDAPYQPGKRPTWRLIRNPGYVRQSAASDGIAPASPRPAPTPAF